MSASSVQTALRAAAHPERVPQLQRFFKTAPGQYAAGDRFIGVYVPDCRRAARAYRELPLDQVEALLGSSIHEERLVALLILVEQFHRGGEVERDSIYRLYLSRTDRINNWDLVDVSAEHIVGGWLEGRDPAPLFELARSVSLWERRIAMLANFRAIKRGRFDRALAVAEALVEDTHDLIHKAVGWMLREIGKRDLNSERGFLDRFAATMPRTMLRYAVERFPELERKEWLARQYRGPWISLKCDDRRAATPCRRLF